MRELLLILILLSFKSHGQRVAINEVDKFTGDKIIKVDASTGKHWSQGDNITKGLMNAVFMSTRYTGSNTRQNLALTLQISIGSTVCLSDTDGKVILLFTDGSKKELQQFSRTDCQENATGSFLLGKTFAEQTLTLKELAEKELAAIRVYTISNYIDFEVKFKRRELIKNHFALMLQTLETEGITQ